MSTSTETAGQPVIATSSAATPQLPALPLRDSSVAMRDLIDLYMAHYAGRDPAIGQRLEWWKPRLGNMPFTEITDDHVFSALEALASMPAEYFAGLDADGNRIFKSKGTPMAPATVNRHHQALASVLTWAVKRRIAPKGWMNPCRSVEKRSEAGNAKTRFLSDDERDRLLSACKTSKWPKLYLLAVMALSTGARKGELQGLRWASIDFPAKLAQVARSKNGDAKALPLVPVALEELQRFKGNPDELIFGSTKALGQPFNFTVAWQQALKDAHIRGFRFHDLRHSCASFLAKNGATLLEIADLLGHRQISMTKRYSHLAAGHRSSLVNRVMGEMR
jgi:integrase